MAGVKVDPLLSYARRDDGQVRIVLSVRSGEGLATSDVALRLHGNGVIDGPATVTRGEAGRFVIQARLAGDQLGTGTWRMKLVAPGHAPLNLQTRLVVRSDAPLALLPGRPPAAVMPEPAPRG